VLRVRALLTLAQEWKIGVQILWLVSKEVLEISLLTPLIIEEQLPKHLIQCKSEFIRLHYVLVFLDFRFEDCFVFSIFFSNTNFFQFN